MYAHTCPMHHITLVLNLKTLLWTFKIVYGLSTHAGYNITSKRWIAWKNRNYTLPFHAVGRSGPLHKTNCTPMIDLLPLPQMPLKLPEIISLAGAQPESLGCCVYNNGTNPVGFVPWNLCKSVHTFCDYTQAFKDCIKEG